MIHRLIVPGAILSILAVVVGLLWKIPWVTYAGAGLWGVCYLIYWNVPGMRYRVNGITPEHAQRLDNEQNGH